MAKRDGDSPDPVWLGLSALEWRLWKGVRSERVEHRNLRCGFEKGRTLKEVRLFNIKRGD
jgi:hypothetical protein